MATCTPFTSVDHTSIILLQCVSFRVVLIRPVDGRSSAPALQLQDVLKRTTYSFDTSALAVSPTAGYARAVSKQGPGKAYKVRATSCIASEHEQQKAASRPGLQSVSEDLEAP